MMSGDTGDTAYIVDINLHPHRVTLLSGQAVYNKSEVDYLYEINSKLNKQIEALKSENADLCTQLQQGKENEKKLSKQLDLEQQKGVVKDQAESLLKIKIDDLERQLKNQRDVHPHSGQTQAGAVGGLATDVTPNLIQIVQDFDKDVCVWHTKLKELELRLAEADKNAEAVEEERKRRKEMEQKLKHTEKLNELLMCQRKDLEDKNKSLESRLKILTNSCEDDSGLVTVKKCGRFEIQRRLLECTRCQQAFGSREEMEASICHYHLASPYNTGDDKNKLFWRCCSKASFRKVSRGCQQGKHLLSYKRARMEE